MNDSRLAEHLLDRHIRENGLTAGAVLPPKEELAQRLDCDLAAITRALHDAERKGRLQRGPTGELILLPPPRVQAPAFSFARSAELHGKSLRTEVVECAMRLPIQDPDDPFFPMEGRAHSALGLTDQEPLIAIVRLRRLHGEPRAFHRAYLNPSRFSGGTDDFLRRYDFARDSLIQAYQDYSYELTSRDTVLMARYLNLYERNSLRHEGAHLGHSPVLDAEQQLFARDPVTGQPFVLEYLQACYLGHWHYEIKNRPPAS